VQIYPTFTLFNYHIFGEDGSGEAGAVVTHYCGMMRWDGKLYE
jgi:hypothetical protein